MATLTRAHEELFKRDPDERYATLPELIDHCKATRKEAQDRWLNHDQITITSDMNVVLDGDPDYQFCDWSFSQLCQMAGVSRSTINRLSHKTASRALQETMPTSEKPFQVLTSGNRIRSIHGVAYTRLWNEELLAAVAEAAPGFAAPQQTDGGSSGLYCGEQDMFAFLIDPTGWVEIDDQAFAPGFFVWNSEVGRRTVGIQTFWFQQVCRNHIVWDAVQVIATSRRHTARVRDFLDVTRTAIAQHVDQRDARRDGLVKVMERAMREKLGDDADTVMKQLRKHGVSRDLGKKAIEIAARGNGFTIFSLVDALTQLSQQVTFIGDRTAIDTKVSSLLALVA